MANRVKVDIIFNAIRNDKGALNKLKADIQGVEKQTGLLGKSFGSLGNVINGLAAGAVLHFAKQLGQQTIELAKTGIAIDRARTAVEAFTGSAYEAERVTRAIKDATGGAITEFDAMQNAARLLSMGLASNAEEAGKLSEIAITLGGAMGRDVKKSFEDFTLLLSNQSILRLDTFGISAGRVRERIKELQQEMPGLDRQTAFVTATLEIGAEKLETLKDAGYETSTSLERLEVRLGDTKNALAEFVADGLLRATDAIEVFVNYSGETNDALTEHSDNILYTANSYEDYITEVARAYAVTGRITPAFWDYNRALMIAGEATQDLYDKSHVLTPELFEQVRAVQGADEAMLNYAEHVTDSRQVVEEYIMSQEEINQAFDDLKLAISGPVREELDKYREKYADITSQIIETQSAIAQWYHEVGDRTPTQSQIAELNNLKDKLGELERAYDDNADAHEEATKRIVFDLLTQRAAMDGLTSDELKLLNDIAYSWGLVDQKTHDAVESIDAALQDLAFGESFEAVKSQIEGIKESLLGIPSNVNVNINVKQSGNIPGKMLNSIYAKASGGPVYPGGVYLVGEEGPELLITGTGGTIIPAHQTARIINATNQYNLTINNPVGTTESIIGDFRLLESLAGV